MADDSRMQTNVEKDEGAWWLVVVKGVGCAGRRRCGGAGRPGVCLGRECGRGDDGWLVSNARRLGSR